MTKYPVIAPKKLIEVALPLDAINAACAREKSIRHGHPSTLHLWWARRPLAAARAVLFGQLVNDPSWKWEIEHPGELPPSHLKASWAASRKRLFAIIEEIVVWENTTNNVVFEKARAEIRKSWRETCEINKDHPRATVLFNPEKIPAFHDPFAGGGAIPIEAQRLGLEAWASDLNPVAVMINKSMIEIPPRFAGCNPIGPIPKGEVQHQMIEQWTGATGLAEDVRRYGAWMRNEAENRIGHLYPKIEITKEMTEERSDLESLIGEKLTVIAWIWARTVKSPNPAFHHVDVPLASTFILSSKEGKEVYIHPVIMGDCYNFTVKVGSLPEMAKHGTKLARGANFRCLLSNIAIEGNYIKSEGRAGRMGSKLMAIVAEGRGRRIYLAPTQEAEQLIVGVRSSWRPEVALPNDLRAFWTPPYGVTHFHHLFTERQLVALTTFSDIVTEARAKIRLDAVSAGLVDDGLTFNEGGNGASAYADAVCVYLACAVDKATDFWSTVVSWMNDRGALQQTFGRQAIPMTWDYAEANPFSSSGGNFSLFIERGANAIEYVNPQSAGYAIQLDAMKQELSQDKLISTDPPYYDNIGYADLSDFFYVWMRRSLRDVFPQIFATVTTPKQEELIAAQYRHAGKENAEVFFLNGMTEAMRRLSKQTHPAMPLTIYYAFKQSETGNVSGTTSSGWETFLTAVTMANLSVTGTWPMRTESLGRGNARGTNALASSIILVCRTLKKDATTIARRQFIRELNQVLPEALDEMTKGAGDQRSPVAPVDLSQAIIGPGMAVFSKYAAVLEADGSPMTVRTALQLINRFLTEGDFDADTQFCVHWFEQYGWKEGKFGDADTLARAKGTSVDGVKGSGVLYAAGGVVRLLKWPEYPEEWNPSRDSRLPVWEVLHQLIRVFKDGGETGAGEVYATVQSKAEASRQLAYRLYTLCERAGWAEDARAYNEIITSWNAIETAAANAKSQSETSLFDE